MNTEGNIHLCDPDDRQIHVQKFGAVLSQIRYLPTAGNSGIVQLQNTTLETKIEESVSVLTLSHGHNHNVVFLNVITADIEYLF